jgi:hypothetical protein
VHALDPTLPRLRLVVRTRRAHELLNAVLQETGACAGSEALTELRRDASRRLGSQRDSDAHVAEQQLDLASRIWNASAGCRASTSEATAIDRVLQRVRAAGDSKR